MKKLICYLFGHKYILLKSTLDIFRESSIDYKLKVEPIVAWLYCDRCDDAKAKSFSLHTINRKVEGKDEIRLL